MAIKSVRLRHKMDNTLTSSELGTLWKQKHKTYNWWQMTINQQWNKLSNKKWEGADSEWDSTCTWTESNIRFSFKLRGQLPKLPATFRTRTSWWWWNLTGFLVIGYYNVIISMDPVYYWSRESDVPLAVVTAVLWFFFPDIKLNSQNLTSAPFLRNHLFHVIIEHTPSTVPTKCQ